MKKNILLAMITFALTGALTACGSRDTGSLVYISDFKAGDYVKLGEYKGIEVEIEAPSVTDDDVSVNVNSTFSAQALPVTDRSVEVGDTANIDYEGKMDGVAFDGGTASGFDLLIGSGRFIPGFEEGVVGMEIGETKDIDLAFPDPYQGNPDLSGKEVVFTVTVNSISAPEVTDEMVAELGIEDCGTVEEFRKLVYDGLMQQAQETYDEEKINAAVTAAEAGSTFKEAPEGMVNRMNENLVETLTSYAQMYGVSVGEYVAGTYGGTAETYQDVLLEQAGLMAQRYVMLAAIAEEEGISITEQELDESLAQIAAGYGIENVEEYREKIDVEAFKEYQLTQKVMKFLGENAVVNSPAS